MSRHHSERPPIVPTRVYSRAEVAEILNVSLSTVKRLLASGQLRASQPPGLRRVFITGQAVLDMLEANVPNADVDRKNLADAVDEDDRW
jgi:excisionase family DNA binding protein